MRLATIIGLVILGVVSRLIPHWPSFTPVLAAALFAGSYINDKKWAYLVPIATMLLSDLILVSIFGIKYFHPTMIFVYGSMALVVFMGTYIKKPRISNVALASIVSSVLFFVVTNFGEWLTDAGNIYPNNLSGLLLCYEAALPFAASQWLPGPFSFASNQLYADLVYNGVFFGGYALAQQWVPVLKVETVKA